MLARSSLLTAVLLISACAAPRGPITFTVHGEVLHGVDPRLFGHFLERASWAKETGVEAAMTRKRPRLKPAVRRLLSEMTISLLRFPGGTDIGWHDWRDMIDGVPGREGPRPTSKGHLGDEVTNRFGYDEFLALAASLDAEPLLVVNLRAALLGVKPIHEAAADAAALVAYCNGPTDAQAGTDPDPPHWPAIRAANGRAEPWNVVWFQIGNETWFYLDALEAKYPADPVGHYVRCVRAYADAMQAVDPRVRFIVDDGRGRMARYARAVRAALGDRIGFTARHYYLPGPIEGVASDGESTSIRRMSDAAIWDAFVAVPRFDRTGRSVLDDPVVRAARRRGDTIAVTEWNWNGWFEGERPPIASRSRLARGLGAAGFLHAMMRDGDVIRVGCQSMLVGRRWGITGIRVPRRGRRRPFMLPTAQVTDLYARHHGGVRLRVDARDVPTYEQAWRIGGIRPAPRVARLDAVVTADARAVYLHLINRHREKDYPITVDLTGLVRLGGEAVHYWLTDRKAPRRGPGPGLRWRAFRYEDGVARLEIPARSVSVIEFRRDE